jgi:hypothetical protein
VTAQTAALQHSVHIFLLAAGKVLKAAEELAAALAVLRVQAQPPPFTE